MNLLFFASDRSIGLTSLCSAQAIAIHSNTNINMVCLAGEKEQSEWIDLRSS